MEHDTKKDVEAHILQHEKKHKGYFFVQAMLCNWSFLASRFNFILYKLNVPQFKINWLLEMIYHNLSSNSILHFPMTKIICWSYYITFNMKINCHQNVSQSLGTCVHKTLKWKCQAQELASQCSWWINNVSCQLKPFKQKSSSPTSILGSLGCWWQI